MRRLIAKFSTGLKQKKICINLVYFDHSEKKCETNIFNFFFRDLLSDDPSYKMEVKMNPDGGGLYVPGLSFVEVSTVAHVNEVI